MSFERKFPRWTHLILLGYRANPGKQWKIGKIPDAKHVKFIHVQLEQYNIPSSSQDHRNTVNFTTCPLQSTHRIINQVRTKAEHEMGKSNAAY